MEKERFLFTSESTMQGHPDKVADQIADAVLDDILTKDPYGRVACEAFVHTGAVHVAGQITTECYSDIPKIVRRTIREIGYTGARYGFDADTCGILISIDEQSTDIALGVNKSMEVKIGEANGMDEADLIGAGDQGIMFGYACTETPELMPLPIMLAHKLAKRIDQARHSKEIPYLCPDGKTQVTIEYEQARPLRLDSAVVSVQHEEYVNERTIRADLIENVIKTVVPAELIDSGTRYFVNPTGRFVIGGPIADTGLTGRKIIVDTYGGMAHHGGGCYSGKDPTKVDRCGSYAARYVAKNIVSSGLAERCEVAIAYAIGVARPVSVSIQTFGTEKVPKDLILDLINRLFDLRPGAIIKYLDLRKPIYQPLACYGHFGRTELDLAWERTDKAELLRQAAGLAPSSEKVGV